MRRVCRAICIGLLALVVLVLGPSVLVYNQTRGRVFSIVHDLPCRSVGLVLGCPPCTPAGRANLYFRYRMEAAVRLFKAGKVDTLLLSGMRTETLDELSCMKEAMVNAGVPPDRLLLDYGSVRTTGSVLRCRDVFRHRSITVVSQPAHARRAVFMASHLGMDAVGYAAQDVGAISGVELKVREAFSRLKAVGEVLLARVWFEGLRRTVNMATDPLDPLPGVPCCLDAPAE